MSDFLSQFQNNNYKKINEDKSTNINNNEQKEALVYEKEPKVSGIKTTEHDTEIDTKYHKRKIIMYITIALTVVALAVIILFIIRYLNQVTIRNFVGVNVSEAKTWGLKNRVEIDIEEVFDKEYNQDIIIWQDKESNNKVQKGSILKIKVSKGADPEEVIPLPDFTTMNYSEIKEWIKENRADNVNIVQEYNEDIESTQFIRKEFKDELSKNNYKRKDFLTIYISKGSQKQDKNITVPDFKGKPKTEIESWAKEKDVTVIYKEGGSETIPEGSAVSQNIEAGTKIAVKDVIEVTISIGKGVTVPNFFNISKDEASQTSNRINDKYKNKVQ